ncbi:MAG: hypothetical protein GX311_01445 [Bacteroidales bacterium]|nr:hypothetical protein [Bacteroidales bacterium]
MFLILALLLAPLFQAKFDIVKLKPLKGAITEPVKNSFNFNDWFSGTYQEQREKYLNETFGFRSSLLRLSNQIAFSFFNKPRASGVIIGKNKYLYEENYIKAYHGTDYIGYDSIMNRMQRLKYVQDTLSKLDKNIILIFAAGKGSFYPEYFPDEYITEKKTTNYETHLQLAQQLGISHIDFNSYFIENKSKSPYPLYPQYGIHWSYYGMCLAADSIIRYIENARNIDMPNLYWDQIEITQPKKGDYDIADGMNLLVKLKTFNMAYPNIKFQSDSAKIKPTVLVISDSFYWGMYNMGITSAFSNSHFWFYNKQIYPNNDNTPTETSIFDLKDEIDKHDVIIIMATEATLPALGWGFIENVYNHFKGIKSKEKFDAEFQTKVTNLRNQIKRDKEWLKKIEEKAASRKISVDSMLTIDAIWMIERGEV